jgi:hypothetical protein
MPVEQVKFTKPAVPDISHREIDCRQPVSDEPDADLPVELLFAIQARDCVWPRVSPGL